MVITDKTTAALAADPTLATALDELERLSILIQRAVRSADREPGDAQRALQELRDQA